MRSRRAGTGSIRTDVRSQGAGTTTGRTAHVLVLAQRDGYANGERPRALMRYLSQRGHVGILLDTRSLSRWAPSPTSPLNRAPSWKPLRAALYVVEGLLWLLGRRPWARRRLSYPLLVAEQALRRRILRAPIHATRADLVIGELPQDSTALLDVTAGATLYDCPTPWADELHDEGRLTERQHTRMRARERRVDDSVDYLSFHWRTYGWYARQHYGIRGDNLRVLDWGCDPVTDRATYAAPMRIVYLGSLSSRFIDLPLLAALSRAYGHIDVYGGPPPDPVLGLNYCGYALPSVLAGYQFGLITCTDDELRREGFSAKHLQYLAAGLPVLVPRWRRNLDLLRGSVPYERASFVATVERFADPVAWQGLADDAYAQAREYEWERTLQPLDSIIAEAVASRVR
jgi:hypothetical protein